MTAEFSVPIQAGAVYVKYKASVGRVRSAFAVFARLPSGALVRCAYLTHAGIWTIVQAHWKVIR